MDDEDKNLGDAVVDGETEQGFTPGPWILDYNKDSSRIKDAEGVTLAVVYDLRRDADGTEEHANARLIAAAPSMATFLMKIYLDYEDDCDCECDSETCCAVVGEPCAKCHANVALRSGLSQTVELTGRRLKQLLSSFYLTNG